MRYIVDSPCDSAMPLVADHIKPRNRNTNQPITVTPKTHNPKPSSSISSSSGWGVSNKMSKLTSMAFNRLGCASLSSAEIIQSEARRVRKQKRRAKKKRSSVQTSKDICDVFCAPPGIGFSSDAVVVDCVEPRRPIATTKPTKHSKTTKQYHFPLSDSPTGLDSDAFIATPYCLLPRGFSEDVMSQERIRFEGVLEGYDRFGELRLDVDNMSYEELLALSDKIGHVATGLREDKLIRCLRKARLPDLEYIPLLPPMDRDSKCSICQDEYEAKDEMGRLECGHWYHIGCIKAWLVQKNSCPICKAQADTGTSIC